MAGPPQCPPPPVARSGTFAGDYGRLIFGARNSRLGFKLKGPETSTVKSSAIAEMDFLGNQPQSSPAPAGSPAVSEGTGFFLLGKLVEFNTTVEMFNRPENRETEDYVTGRFG